MNTQSSDIVSLSPYISQGLVRAITDTVFLLDTAGWILDVKNTTQFSFEVVPAKGMNLSEIFNTSLANQYKQAIDRCVEEQDVKVIQYDLPTSGGTRYYEARLAPVGTVQVVTIIKDLTESIEKKQKIKERDDWFQIIFNSSRDGLVVELDEKIISVNDAFVQLYGYSSQMELLGKKISAIHAEETDQMMLDFGRKRLMGTPVPSVYESKGKCKDGTIIDIEVSASIFELHGQKFIIATNRNISERKKIERKLKEQNEELQKANAELDRFVYSASHDLRAPLRSLLGLVNLFRIDHAEANKNQYLDRMEKSIHHLDHFIKDVIQYSRSSRMELAIEHLNLSKLMHQAKEKAAYHQGSSPIDIILEVDPALNIKSDEYRLSVIFNNLISNAIRFLDESKEKPCLKISASVSGEDLLLYFEDNGIGIGEEHLERIFQMFYRGHDKNVGAGLGLYIVRETLKVMKGCIEVRSTVGSGTVFQIDIPIQK